MLGIVHGVGRHHNLRKKTTIKFISGVMVTMIPITHLKQKTLLHLKLSSSLISIITRKITHRSMLSVKYDLLHALNIVAAPSFFLNISYTKAG